MRLTAHRERSASGDRVVVAVADDDLGIPPAEQARVFDLFYHGDGWAQAARTAKGAMRVENGAGSFALPLYLKGARQ
ncbi:MAG: hypothetical protein ACLTDR_01185 [Adlercreutzia equolifaciens]